MLSACKLPVEKQELVESWAQGTFEATVVQQMNRVDSPASASGFECPLPCSPLAADWKVIAIEDRTRSVSVQSLASVLPFAYEVDAAHRLTALANCAVTVASMSEAEEAVAANPMFAHLKRRNAQGSEAMISPMAIRPAQLPSVQIAGPSSPRESPIKRVFNHLPWKAARQQPTAATPPPPPAPSVPSSIVEKHLESPQPGTWLASRSPQWGGHIRSYSGPAVVRYASPPSSPCQRQSRSLSSYFSRGARSSPLRRPHTPYVFAEVTDEEEKLEMAQAHGLGLTLASPIASDQIIMRDPTSSQLSLASPMLMSFTSPQMPEDASEHPRRHSADAATSP